MSNEGDRLIPALGWHLLTPLYDPLVRWTVREREVKAALLGQARLQEAARVLDVGCGSGTLLLLARERSSSSKCVGVDGDPRILAIARGKAASMGKELPLVRALSDGIPFRDCAFDRVLSSLMLHHLSRAAKIGTLREVYRVLRPGGELHVADFGRPHNRLMAALSWTVRLADGLGRTSDNLRGLLPELFRNAGFEGVSETSRFGTLFGTLQLYSARRPGVRA